MDHYFSLDSGQKKRALVLGLALIGVAIAARLIPGPRTIDDAYITFRYARNILAGYGFVFNPGEHVLGTTTPAYTLLMAGIGFFSGGPAANFPVIAWILNSILDAATCLLIWRVGSRLNASGIGLITSVIWAIAPYSVSFSIGGLETSFIVFLLIGAFLAHLEKRHTLAALAGILSILTRPDSVLLILPLIIDRLYMAIRKGERLSASELCAFFLPGLSWAAFAAAYFGSPIPHSVTAKLLVYRLDPFSALIRFLQHYATPFLENSWAGSVFIGIGLFLYPTLYIAGALSAIRRNPRFWPLTLYPWLYLLVFAIPNPLIFRWYLTPPLPPYFLFILLGAGQIFTALLSKIQNKSLLPYIPTASFILVSLLPICSTLNEWRLHPDHGNVSPAPDMAYIKLELLYKQAADQITPLLHPGDRLAAGDVGVLGYFTNASILDTVGLNSPESLKYYPEDPANYVINYAIPARLVNMEQPDWVVILEVYGRRSLLPDPDFQKNYHLLHTIPTDMYGSRGMLIFQRNP